jgi:hypothetical protein
MGRYGGLDNKNALSRVTIVQVDKIYILNKIRLQSEGK